MRRYDLKPKVAIHCKTQYEADVIRTVFSDPSYTNEQGKPLQALSQNWDIYKEKTILLPHAALFGCTIQGTRCAYWDEIVEARTIIDYIYGVDDTTNITEDKSVQVMGVKGEIFSSKKDPYGTIGMLGPNQEILVFKSTIKSGYRVGDSYMFFSDKWFLIDDMEISLKLIQNEKV